MTALVSLLFIAMIPIDCKIINFSLHLYIHYSTSYSIVVLYIRRGFWPKLVLQNQLNIYILTVGEHFLDIAKPKNASNPFHQIVQKF